MGGAQNLGYRHRYGPREPTPCPHQPTRGNRAFNSVKHRPVSLLPTPTGGPRCAYLSLCFPMLANRYGTNVAVLTIQGGRSSFLRGQMKAHASLAQLLVRPKILWAEGWKRFPASRARRRRPPRSLLIETRTLAYCARLALIVRSSSSPEIIYKITQHQQSAGLKLQ